MKYYSQFLPFLFLSLLTQPAYSQSASDFKALQTPQMTVILPGDSYFDEKQERYPWWTKPLRSLLISYQINESADADSEKCNSEKWKRRLQDKKISGFSQISSQIEDYVKTCESEIADGWDDPFSNSYKTMMSQIKLQPENYEKARYVLFQFPHEIKLKGFLVLHDFKESRPMIIFRTGIFSNSSEFYPERYLFRQLFEQAGFNMLVLESNSGQEFIHRNKTIAIGGFDEGIQNFQIAKLLQDPTQPISKLVQKVHLLGVSFGGHGVLYAALLNDLNQTQKKSPVISSAIALCPLINYRDTFDAHQAQGVISGAIEYWAKHRMHLTENEIPGFQPQNFLSSVIEFTEKNYQGPLSWDGMIKLPVSGKPRGGTVGGTVPYWQANNFWQDYQNIQTPVLILATEKDPLVLYELNSKRLQNGYMKTGNSQLKVIPFLRGYHCSFPGAYKWAPMQTLLEQYYRAF